ncbi:MAG TPA: flagellar FlbD family protein [Armatimonadota bacterium]|nr:flagellar FlbD family protein [Armatimonadota bacterium]HOS42113.1 flagellar FlbD family protein [Armatimonadota bacterium]
MIRLSRLQGEMIVINAGLIEFVEATPDTLISMATGRKVMVRESVDEVIERVTAYYARIGRPPFTPLPGEQDEA